MPERESETKTLRKSKEVESNILHLLQGTDRPLSLNELSELTPSGYYKVHIKVAVWNLNERGEVCWTADCKIKLAD